MRMRGLQDPVEQLHRVGVVPDQALQHLNQQGLEPFGLRGRGLSRQVTGANFYATTRVARYLAGNQKTEAPPVLLYPPPDPGPGRRARRNWRVERRPEVARRTTQNPSTFLDVAVANRERPTAFPERNGLTGLADRDSKLDLGQAAASPYGRKAAAEGLGSRSHRVSPHAISPAARNAASLDLPTLPSMPIIRPRDHSRPRVSPLFTPCLRTRQKTFRA